MDDELRALLLEEVDRRAAEVLSESSLDVARRVAHSLKGAFGLAGEREVSEAMGRIERRIVVGETAAVEVLRELVTRLNGLLREGRGLPKSTWPDPPRDLRPSRIDPSCHTEYVTAIHDRLLRIDVLLTDPRPAPERVLEVFREVHTLKGAALAVGDEIMTWFCHGLEERLKTANDDAVARRALDLVERFRGVMAEIADAPEHALSTLQLMAGPPPSARPPVITPLPLPPKRPSFPIPAAPGSNKGESDARSLGEDGTVRVSSAVLDNLFDRAGQFAQLRAPLAGGAAELTVTGGQLRLLQREVREALRMIGPPRPWGAPAAAIHRLEACAEQLLPAARVVEAQSARFGSMSRRLGREGDGLAAAVHALRTSLASALFDPVAAAVHSESRREEKLVDVAVSGAETPLDRRLVEALLEPVRQIARNAVVHGLEPAERRRAAGKRERGTIKLSAQQRDGNLVLAISDDGAGVDLALLRSRAIERGLVELSELDELDDRAALSLLFQPGFSLRADAELSAGRGVGLDLAMAAVQRLGGTIQIDSRHGEGVTTTLIVPAEGALVRVVMLRVAGDAFALPVRQVGAIRTRSDAPREVQPLVELVGDAIDPALARPWTHAVEIVPAESTGPRAWIGVEAVGTIDEVALRALPELVRAAGPWAAAVVYGDDLRLCLDGVRLAQAARLRTSHMAGVA